MKPKIAFDVSGLAWGYSTGVQNLYWALLDAYCSDITLNEKTNIIFYDRSGYYNKKIEEKY